MLYVFFRKNELLLYFKINNNINDILMNNYELLN